MTDNEDARASGLCHPAQYLFDILDAIQAIMIHLYIDRFAFYLYLTTPSIVPVES